MPLWTEKDLNRLELKEQGATTYQEPTDAWIARLQKRIRDLQEGAWPIVRQELEARGRADDSGNVVRRGNFETRKVPTSYIDTLVAIL